MIIENSGRSFESCRSMNQELTFKEFTAQMKAQGAGKHSIMSNSSKYELLAQQLQALIEGEPDLIANLSNASAAINEALENINWAGFYLVKENMLVLGPFQGKPACIRIPFGKGVCGTAAKKDETQLVKDVHEFPGHIACDSASRSEIVIPIHNKSGVVAAVLDIDSPDLARFDETDQSGLEHCVNVLEKYLLF